MIDIPNGLDRDMLYDTFGKEATDYYLERIEQRQEEGKIYYNPVKTAYIWMVKDKASRSGFWKVAVFRNRRKAKNHGRS